ncbi:hypothetical protein CIK65_16695 [Brevibacterium aurantiacum]|uniref:Swt1-like HEPN domain-containing protein n=1 Tax=Brevibacterium aurantiacum TaxID=273384 RepID=A0A2A3YQI4_BREAU|nr:hypothetical protein CIK65_16695 [Brevibacterium aurantiacum]
MTFGSPLTVQTIADAISEIGSGLVAALDHAMFEVDPKNVTAGLQFLGPREIEGLRGAGLISIDDDFKPKLTQHLSSKLLKDALAEYISRAVESSDQLPVVVSGLWRIERTIRGAVRTQALAQYSSDWRASSVGSLKEEVLRRARLEGHVAAKSIQDIRDPLEWLNLGELLDIVRGDKFKGLGVEQAIWRKLQEQLVPIRNRLAHVRMLKSDDHEIVQTWVAVVRDQIRF